MEIKDEPPNGRDESDFSPIGRLLEELSWEGNARRYRAGGRGFENVLVTEVFAALDHLPRERFLGSLLRSVSDAGPQLEKIVADVENVVIDVLPGGPDLAPGGPNIQPDVYLRSPSTTVLIEAKRIRTGSFQPEQLAREYLALMRETTPNRLLLLILPAPPPVPVQGVGILSIDDAVLGCLSEVHARADPAPDLGLLQAGLKGAYGWITWPTIRSLVQAAADELGAAAEPSVLAAVRRTAGDVVRAIDRHS